MGIIIGSPLQQGALVRRYDEVETGALWLSPPRQEQYKKLYAFLDEIDLPLPEVALRMVISNPTISTVLVGAKSVEEVEQNARSVEAGTHVGQMDCGSAGDPRWLPRCSERHHIELRFTLPGPHECVGSGLDGGCDRCCHATAGGNLGVDDRV